jgi:hypothetical protein
MESKRKSSRVFDCRRSFYLAPMLTCNLVDNTGTSVSGIFLFSEIKAKSGRLLAPKYFSPLVSHLVSSQAMGLIASEMSQHS